MSNPLDVNCTAVKVDSNNKVVGIRLGITPVQGSKYELYRVRMRDEYEAGGQTVANCSVLDKNGVNTGLSVRMAWPSPGPQFTDSALPGNPNNQHMITNGFDANQKVGPLALYVGGHNAPDSDIVFGLGLPWNRHVSFDVVFKERGGVVVPPDPDEDARIAKLEAWAKQWSAQYPKGPQYV